MTFNPQSKKCWIVPDESLPPDFLVLGSILKRPNEPMDILNRHTVTKIDPSVIDEEREQITKSIVKASNAGFSFGLGLSSVLASIVGAGPSLDANRAKSVSYLINAANVRAQHFIPPDDYVNRALRAKKVDDYVRQSGYNAKVYMVVGVAVASKVSRTAIGSKDKGGGAGIAVGPPGTALEVSADVHANRGSGSLYQDTVENVILAYRLRRFRYSKIRDEFKQRDEVKAALYRADQEDSAAEEEEDEEDFVAGFTYFDGVDVSAADAGMKGFDGDGEED
ncbi:hypothetical protein B0T10DRAFT_463029 [Thelonectria olida]|uniref:Uncharacterized protein n=1 Tax=Thelonectria olida TaxID=1576542 RepID=A0A9P8VYA0_9HYPO|nr:hypothetical protein B0T10DRAFT_463029 [Thelonectria olida]